MKACEPKEPEKNGKKEVSLDSDSEDEEKGNIEVHRAT